MVEPGLQFDTAEVAGGAPGRLVCSDCHKDVAGSYFEVGGRPVCEACRDVAASNLAPGHGFVAFLKALALGGGAAALCAGLYGAINMMTTWRLSLITIVVGMVVGRAVRMGSGHRGGWLYQGVAVVLTYLACCFAEVPSALRETLKEDPDEKSVLYVLLMGIMMMVVSLAAPFMGGASSIMGIVIIGIGLWEAWRVNRVEHPEIRGPFAVAAAAGGPPPPPVNLVKSA